MLELAVATKLSPTELKTLTASELLTLIDIVTERSKRG